MSWAPRLMEGSTKQFGLSHLYSERRRAIEEPEFFEDFHPDQTWLLGYAIPPFQRPVVWEHCRWARTYWNMEKSTRE